jgi:hypothetical protein
MKPCIIFPLLLIAVSMGARRAYSQAQDLDKDRWVCPSIYVDCPDAVGRDVKFTVVVTAGVPADAKFSFKWTVSGGQITSGQGTPSISVDTRGLEGKSFTATVELGGFPQACVNNKAACSTRVSHQRHRKRRR